MKPLLPITLTADAFRPFGEVIETDNASEIHLINKGTTTRFHDIAPVDVSDKGGRPIISIFRGKPFVLPIHISMMERHPLGSQAFMPLAGRPYLVVVAQDMAGRPGEPQAFLASETQGVSYAKGTWHHPLLALGDVSDFLVLDRGSNDANLEEADYPEPYAINALT
ncbi:MAG: ureidoglycolate lyase [Pseudomonadota bacterium]|nr:ureidoglycolate lyase [Pseudomonadota bacterium]